MSAPLRVSGHSQAKEVAGALAARVKAERSACLEAVGAAAVNQAVKAISIARAYVQPAGLDLVAAPEFAQIEIDGRSYTSIRITVETR